MFKLLFLLPVIVVVDPFLLYWVWPHLNVWAQAVGLLVYPLAATLYIRSRAIQDGDLATRVLRTGLRFAVWYPGPISKLVSLFLLLPPVERAVAGYAMRHFQAHLLRGVGRPGPAGVAPNAPPGTPFAVPSAGQNSDKLKPAKGRVVE